MTISKSVAEKMAELHESELDRLRITRTNSYHYLCGFRACIEQAERIKFDIDAGNMGSFSAKDVIYLDDLKSLLEPK